MSMTAHAGYDRGRHFDQILAHDCHDLVGGGSFGASIDLPALLLERRQATGGQGADQACSGDHRGAKAKLPDAPERQSDHRSPEGEAP